MKDPFFPIPPDVTAPWPDTRPVQNQAAPFEGRMDRGVDRFPEVAAGGGTGSVLPFAVLDGSEEGYVQVIAASSLFNFVTAAGDEVTITGLGTDHDAEGAAAIYLKGTVVAGEITAAEIELGAAGEPLVEFDEDDEQTGFRVLIATLGAEPEDPLSTPGRAVGEGWAYQHVFTHLRAMFCCVDGKPAIYPLAS